MYSVSGSTGYIYYPMSFWENAKVSIENMPGTESKQTVCYQIGKDI